MAITVEETDMASESPIQKFYRGQSILITGGTGFVGTLLIEKLLRTCHNLSMIYLLIRPKKNLDPKERLDKIFNNVVYDRLKEEVPKFREKITLIKGDCSLPDLGMAAEDRATILREVSLIFHSAATVNFDVNLKNAILTNVVSTKQLMEMCMNMPKLKAMIYVSTAYSNALHSVVEERFYEPPMTYQNIINIVDSMSVEMLEKVKKTLLGNLPDAYIFSKCITEQVVQDYGRNLPVGLFRPGMVVSTYKEPLQGWTNNIYGAIGIASGIFLGVLRTYLGDPNATAQAVPGDYTVNALIAVAWEVAKRKEKDMDPFVYNYTPPETAKASWVNTLEFASNASETLASEKVIWYWSIIVTKCWYYHMLLRIFLHLLPGFFIDLGLRIAGKKPMMLDTYKKIHKFLDLLSFYIVDNLSFYNKNVYDLWDSLSEQDKKLFHFSMERFDWQCYMTIAIIGGRQYLWNEDPSTIPQANKRLYKLKILHYTVKYIALSLLAFFVFRMIGNSWL